MALGLGHVSRLMTRSLYALLNTRHYWYEPITISPEARHELIFWFDNLNYLNGQGIWHTPSALRVVYSDASNTGYAVEHGFHMAQGLWTQDEATSSSTWRELKAVRMVLESLVEKLTNQNVAQILQNGSKKQDL